jgi:hypothetical protein
MYSPGPEEPGGSDSESLELKDYRSKNDGAIKVLDYLVNGQEPRDFERPDDGNWILSKKIARYPDKFLDSSLDSSA